MEEQTPLHRTGRKKLGCKALHVTPHRALRIGGLTKPKRIHPMNKGKLQKLVTKTVALHREIAEKTEELKALKATLVQEAKLHPKDHVQTDSGGKRWTAAGSNGCVARVSFPTATLVSEVDGKGELIEQCKAVAGEAFRKLFTPVKIYQLVENFRTEAKTLLPEAKAEELTKLCENEAAPRVSFETARESTAPNAK